MELQYSYRALSLKCYDFGFYYQLLQLKLSITKICCEYGRLMDCFVVYLTTLFQWRKLFRVEWRNTNWRLNWKGCGRKRSWYNFKMLSQHTLGWTEENHETPHSGQPASEPGYEPGTFRIWRTANHSTTGFGREADRTGQTLVLEVLSPQVPLPEWFFYTVCKK
jgi:hypothetical protein